MNSSMLPVSSIGTKKTVASNSASFVARFSWNEPSAHVILHVQYAYRQKCGKTLKAPFIGIEAWSEEKFDLLKETFLLGEFSGMNV